MARPLERKTRQKIGNNLVLFLNLTPVYPQLRMVSLHSTHTRMLLGAAFDSSSVGEITLANGY